GPRPVGGQARLAGGVSRGRFAGGPRRANRDRPARPRGQGVVMSLSSAAVDLSNALKTVTLAWEEARQEWNDPVSRDFEANHWEPLESQVRAVLQAIDRLAPVLAKALRDCSS